MNVDNVTFRMTSFLSTEELETYCKIDENTTGRQRPIIIYLGPLRLIYLFIKRLFKMRCSMPKSLKSCLIQTISNNFLGQNTCVYQISSKYIKYLRTVRLTQENKIDGWQDKRFNKGQSYLQSFLNFIKMWGLQDEHKKKGGQTDRRTDKLKSLEKVILNRSAQ